VTQQSAFCLRDGLRQQIKHTAINICSFVLYNLNIFSKGCVWPERAVYKQLVLLLLLPVEGLSDDHKNKIMDTVIALNIFLDVPKPWTWIVHDPSGLSEFKPMDGVLVEYPADGGLEPEQQQQQGQPEQQQQEQQQEQQPANEQQQQL
jgi:hypothetical protein